MKRTPTLSFFALAIMIIAACSTSKKTTAPTATVATAQPATTTPTTTDFSPFVSAPPSVPADVIVPGDKELTALQTKFKEVTMQTLTAGHAIYIGACTRCHLAESIAKISEEHWPALLDDMAGKANLTEAEKDAVNKYVLSIKATQPK